MWLTETADVKGQALLILDDLGDGSERIVAVIAPEVSLSLI